MHTYIPLLPSRSPATVEPNSAMEDVSVQQERVVGLFLPHYMFLRGFFIELESVIECMMHSVMISFVYTPHTCSSSFALHSILIPRLFVAWLQGCMFYSYFHITLQRAPLCLLY